MFGIWAFLSENEMVSIEPMNSTGAEVAAPSEPQRIAPPDLVQSVEDFCSAKTLRKRITSFVSLSQWTRREASSAADLSGLSGVVEYLETNAEIRSQFQQVFAEVLSEMDCVSLFAEAGIPSDHSLPSEIAQRIAARLLPSAREHADTSRLLVTLYPNKRTVEHFLDISPDSFQRLITILTPATDPNFASHEYLDLQQALRLLSSRVAAIGLNPEVRARSSAIDVAQSPFYQLFAATDEVIAASDPDSLHVAMARWNGIVQRSRTEMVLVHQHMENTGVSVELIFDIRKIAACLARMESILDVLTADGEQPRIAAVHGLLGHLMEGRLHDLSLSALLRENLNLISRKMVERTGHSGEHYIAHNRKEYAYMWAAAIGGGLLTVLTAAIKLRVYDAHLPLFVEGFAAGTNYAASLRTGSGHQTTGGDCGHVRGNHPREPRRRARKQAHRIRFADYQHPVGRRPRQCLCRRHRSPDLRTPLAAAILSVVSFCRIGYSCLRNSESDRLGHRHLRNHHRRHSLDGGARRRLVRKLRRVLPSH